MDEDRLAFRKPSLRRLNINLLYSLHAILEAPTLSEAAQSMALTQPAASMALRRLREHFGDPLIFYAHPRRLTALAEALRPKVAKLLREIDDTFALSVEFDPATTTRTIGLTAPEMIELMFFSRLAPRVIREAPGITLNFVPFTYDSVDRLFERGSDIVIVPASMANPRLCSLPLFDCRLVGMVWSKHAADKALTREEYTAGRHVALFDEIEQPTLGDQPTDPVLEQRHIAVRTAHYSMLPQLVIGTDLIVTMANWLAQHYASILPVRVVALPIEQQPIALIAQWQPHRASDPLILWLLEQFKAAMDWPGASSTKLM